jgi:hypothetical protein
VVVQSNKAEQEQTANQYSAGGGSGWSKGDCGCEREKGKGAAQSADFGDQSIGEQSNESNPKTEQGNENVNFSPAFSGGTPKQAKTSCGCDGHDGGAGGASTRNSQGNGNESTTVVLQSNKAKQEQTANQLIL